MFNYLKPNIEDFGREVRQGCAKDAKEDGQKMKTKFFEFKNKFKNKFFSSLFSKYFLYLSVGVSKLILSFCLGTLRTCASVGMEN